MADVRSLLRNERAQRRINHPQATYTATGTLECSVCHIPLKSDQEVWNKHLKSTQHAMRAERLRLNTAPQRRQEAAPTTREISVGSKKRKADAEGDDSRKRVRPVVDVLGGFFDEIIETNNTNTTPVTDKTQPPPPTNPTSAPTSSAPTTTLPTNPKPPPTTDPTPIDEDEWAAFERDIATPPPDPSLPAALTAEATISAAPLSAAEIAAQSREQASRQAKEKREAEVEGEKEDAARALEEEFDEMEGLEERVARLRRLREEIRGRRRGVEGEGGGEGLGGVGQAEEERAVEEKGGVDGDESDDDYDEEEDMYGWGGLKR